MHTTTIKTKDGKTYIGYINLFKPELGFVKLFQYEDHIRFDDIESMITEGEIIDCVINKKRNITKLIIQDIDELKRAKILLEEAREYHRFGMDENTPLQEWEK